MCIACFKVIKMFYFNKSLRRLTNDTCKARKLRTILWYCVRFKKKIGDGLFGTYMCTFGRNIQMLIVNFVF